MLVAVRRRVLGHLRQHVALGHEHHTEREALARADADLLLVGEQRVVLRLAEPRIGLEPVLERLGLGSQRAAETDVRVPPACLTEKGARTFPINTVSKSKLSKKAGKSR